MPGVVIHPFWATTCSSRSVVSALDLVQFREGTRLERRMLTSAVRRAGAVLVLSKVVADEIQSRFDVDVQIGQPFPDLDWYCPLTPRPEAVGRRIRIAYWGGWHARKGMVELLDALARSGLAHDVEIHSTGNPQIPSPVAIVGHGQLDAGGVVRLVDSCDLAVYPSQEEGFGLPVFESLLRRRPVIIRDLPVYREFTNPSEWMVRVDELSPELLVEGIEAALSIREDPSRQLLSWPSREASVHALRGALLRAVSS